MFSHYLKTAFRNLKGNPVFSLISIICMAVGTVIFAVLEYDVDNEMFFDRRLPEHDRIVEAYYEQRLEDGTPDTVPCFEFMMQSNFESPAIENVFASVFDSKYGTSSHGANTTYNNMVLTGPDGSTTAVTGHFDRVMSDYYRYKGMTMLYGSRLPENLEEIVVKESLLKKLSVKGDPASFILEASTPEGGTNHRQQYHIVNVIRDDKWSRRISAEVLYNYQGGYSMYAVLADGVDMDQANRMLEEKAFARYSPEGNRLIVPQVRPIQEDGGDTGRIWKRLLSVLVLATGIICFMGNLITTFMRNWHDNRLRICLGSRRQGLAWLLTCQILVTLLPALAVAVISAFFLIPFLNSLETGIVYYHLPYILLIEIAVTVLVFIVCMLAVTVVVRNMDVTAPDRKNGLSHRERTLLKYAFLTIELSLSVMALGSSLTMISTAPRPYCPLSRSELRHILALDMRNGSYERYRDVIISGIRSLPSVEDVLLTETPVVPETEELMCQAWVRQFLEEGSDGYDYRFYPRFIFSDTAYFRFFNIPVEHLDYDVSDEGVYVSERLWNLMAGNVPQILNVRVVDDYHEDFIETPYRIAGIFRNAMGELEEYGDGYFLGQFNVQHPGMYLYVKFREGTDMAGARKTVGDICQDATGGYCGDDIAAMGGKWLGTSHDTRIMMMLLFTAAAAGMLMVLLSIISIISADTGARRKEVALRKIHGAKASDIAGMFIRPYLLVLLISVGIGYPCSGLLPGLQDEPLLSWRILPVMFITAAVMALSTAWKLRRIMRTNPAEVIKNE